jgi:hypothetical protein
MAAWFGAVPAVLIGGLGILAVVVVWTKVFPALYRVERFPTHEKRAACRSAPPRYANYRVQLAAAWLGDADRFELSTKATASTTTPIHSRYG